MKNRFKFKLYNANTLLKRFEKHYCSAYPPNYRIAGSYFLFLFNKVLLFRKEKDKNLYIASLYKNQRNVFVDIDIFFKIKK